MKYLFLTLLLASCITPTKQPQATCHIIGVFPIDQYMYFRVTRPSPCSGEAVKQQFDSPPEPSVKILNKGY